MDTVEDGAVYMSTMESFNGGYKTHRGPLEVSHTFESDYKCHSVKLGISHDVEQSNMVNVINDSGR